jgi:acyl carrier protein
MTDGNTDDLRDDLQTVFRDVFGDDDIVLTDSMTADDVPGWDSLAHINLIIATEKHFGIKFATAEISGLKGDDQNIGSFLRLIGKKLSAKG